MSGKDPGKRKERYEIMENEFRTEQFIADVTIGLCDAGERDITCSIGKCEKPNESYNALTFSKENAGIGLNINLDHVMESIDSGADYEDVVSDTVKTILDGLSNEKVETLKQFTENILQYEENKKNLVIDLISVEGHEDILNTVPHKVMEDLAAVYRFIVNNDESGCGTVLITNDMLKAMGVSEEQLKADADVIAPITRPICIRSIAEVIRGMLTADGTPDDIIEMMISEGEPPLFVASVAENVHGAGIMAYPEFFREASEYVGGNFFILPSSIHEVLLLPDTGESTAEDLKEMVISVNSSVLDPKDKLSDNVYHYDVEAKLFETGEKYVNRINSQQAMG